MNFINHRNRVDQLISSGKVGMWRSGVQTRQPSPFVMAMRETSRRARMPTAMRLGMNIGE